MAKYPGLRRRGSIFSYRAIISLDLRPLYADENGKPRRELRVSLKTSDRAEAEDLWLARSRKQKKEFRAKRARLAALRESERVKTVATIPEDESKALNALWMRSALETDEAMRIDGLDDDDFEPWAHDNPLTIINGAGYAQASGDGHLCKYDVTTAGGSSTYKRMRIPLKMTDDSARR